MDRDEAVRKAEKLLRQGNLAAAITEYARVAAAHPHDLPTLNKLGELYQRAGQTSDAIAQYARVADQWLREGLYPKAAAHYRKILKLSPQDEPAMLQLVQASIRQGLLDEAKTWLRTAREGRIARGDDAGADDLTLKLSDLDPTDFDARMTALRVRLGRERSPELVAEVRGVIAELERQGRSEETETLLASLIRLDPDDVDARVRVARAAMRRGDLTAARGALPMDTAGSERYEVIALAAELELIAGNLEAGQPLLQRMLSVDREHAIPEIIALGDRLFAQGEEAVSFVCVESVVDHHAAAREFVEAGERLTRFLAQSPQHVPALLRLVEVCVDGDLDAEATAASGQLADVYLGIGEASKARVIAEDLVIREPRSREHRARLRRALVALGEGDPDAIILDILTEQLGEDLDLAEIDEIEQREIETIEEIEEVEEIEPAIEARATDAVTDVEPEAAQEPEAEAESESEPDSDSESGTAVEVEAAIGAEALPEVAADLAPELDADPFAVAAAAAIEGGVPAEDETPEPAWSSESGLLFEPIDLGGWTETPVTVEPPPPATVSSDVGSEGPGVSARGGRPRRKKKPAPVAEPEAAAQDDVVGDLTEEIDLTSALNALAQSGASTSDTPEESALAAADGAATDAAAADGDEYEDDEDGAGDGSDGSEDGLEAGAVVEGVAGHGVRAGAGAVNGARGEPAGHGGAEDDLEQVFDGLRARAAGDIVDMTQPDQSARLLSMAETYQAAGMYEEARAALEQVATDSRHRFRAAAALGRLFWQQGDADAALRWLELASEAPAPDPEAGRVVMYELAEKLERTGETTRALAVFLDLLAEQDDYRDVRARVDRLTRVQR